MKKMILILFIPLILLIACSSKEEIIKEEVKEEEKSKVEVTPFVDDNPITLGLYTQKDYNSSRELITSYSSPWLLNVDIGAFETFGTNEKNISGNIFQYVWNDYWNKYENINNYRIGYYIRFKTTSGDLIEATILKPVDVMPIWQYFQVYLYDEVHQKVGSWYSHIEDKDFNENTIMTTIKLTGSTKIAEVVSPIELMVFSYDGNGDFDFDTNMYLGTSNYAITINKSN